ncbi:hypothetical protein [Streptomyces sp. NPDC020917]|uniref:hypothetical protein n=1 Tax=Streptomyces sp. NPDC020917 TaxID=3365102 RepID=UPI0037904FA7
MKDYVVPLVIAVIGLAATAVGALIGARSARFGAEQNAEAARQQVRDQGAVEHGHWLRQQRFDTYESFLAAWDECLRVTQESAENHDPDPTDLVPLRNAADRMAERSRRIALLGPAEVTREAHKLTETMQRDVEITTRFIEMTQATLTAIDSSPTPDGTFEEATNEFVRHRERLAALMQANFDQGGSLRDLDGHPLLGEVMRSGQQYQRLSEEALRALRADAAQLVGAVENAAELVSALTQNREARELSRARFTAAVQQALGTPPMTEANPRGL